MCSKKYKKMQVVSWVTLGLLGCDVSNDVNKSDENMRNIQSQPTVIEIKKPEKKEIDAWVNKQIYNSKEINPKEIDYLYNSVDLNGDGKLETFVFMQDINFCSAKGCSSYLFDDEGNMIGDMAVVDEPIFVSNKSTTGWKDIIVRHGENYHALKFDGKAYPLDPSLQPIVMRDEKKAQQLVIATSAYQQNGYELDAIYPTEILMPFEEYVYRFNYYDEPSVFYQATVNLDNENIDLIKHEK